MYLPPGFDNEPHTTPVHPHLYPSLSLSASILHLHFLGSGACFSAASYSVSHAEFTNLLETKSDRISQPVPLMCPRMWPRSLCWVQVGTPPDTMIQTIQFNGEYKLHRKVSLLVCWSCYIK